jgi:hypothetical protein
MHDLIHTVSSFTFVKYNAGYIGYIFQPSEMRDDSYYIKLSQGKPGL